MFRPAMFRERPSRLKVFSRWMSASSCTLTEKGTSMTDSVRLVAVTTISSNLWISERLGLFGVPACPCAEAFHRTQHDHQRQDRETFHCSIQMGLFLLHDWPPSGGCFFRCVFIHHLLLLDKWE